MKRVLGFGVQGSGHQDPSPPLSHSTRANFLLRGFPPCVAEEFAASHDESSRTCLNNLLPDDRWELAGLPQLPWDEGRGTLGQLGGLSGNGEGQAPTVAPS